MKATATSLSSVVVVPTDDELRVVVFHSLLGKPHLVEFESASDRRVFVEAVETGPAETGIDSVDAVLSVEDGEARQELRASKERYLQDLHRRVRFLSLLTSQACNLGCSYCIADANMESARTVRSVTMRWDTARQGLDWYFSMLGTDTTAPYINFSGGEPLLNWPVVEQSLAYVRGRYADRFARGRFSINTNATLITPAIARTLKEYDVLVATSLDGTPATSDRVRIAKGGGLGVSDKVLRGWGALAAAGHPVGGFMATFNDANISGMDESVVEFAQQMGFTWLRVDCDVIHLSSVTVDEVIDRIWRIYQRGKALGITIEGFWSAAMHNLVSPHHHEPSFFCGAVSGETISVHPDGHVTACGFSRTDLGHVSRSGILNVESHRALVDSYFPGDRAFCHGCIIEGSCAGGCNIAREEATTQGTDRVIEFNCALYRELTKRLLVDHFSDAGPRGEHALTILARVH